MMLVFIYDNINNFTNQEKLMENSGECLLKTFVIRNILDVVCFENCFIGKTVGLVTGSIRRKNE